jgi:asparagine synthase (glutamine-hydrolysing)
MLRLRERMERRVSGIVGLIQTNGSPLQPDTLRNMAEFLAFRGPDGLDVWDGSSAGLGVAKLRISGAFTPEPAQLDTLIIAADARLDATEELKERLRQRRPIDFSHPVSDSILILHAYLAWGPDCVKYLRGDFAFGIWDIAAKSLFCARDHFGIKPFYYAYLGGLFLFSNTLNCLRRHGSVSCALNEPAIGDFLLFGLNCDKATTTFRDIQRLPPAHSLSLSDRSLRIACYWRPPTEERIRYSRDEEYVACFNEILTSAVADRLTSDRIGILLSGGLDSGAVATVAKEVSDSRDHLPEVRSYTVGYDHLIPDEERHYAKSLAQHLGIRNRYLALDDVDAFEQRNHLGGQVPEPMMLTPAWPALFRIAASECRAVLSGEGADNLMYFQMWPYLRELQRTGQRRRMVSEALWFARFRSFPWRGLLARANSLFTLFSRQSDAPSWIAPEFARRNNLTHRWNECRGLVIPVESHASRPKAHASMYLPQWTNLFETLDPGVTNCHVEVRYPFLDLRMVNYLLALPVFPWCYKKKILRTAMAGRIPEEIRLRRKTPLSADPVVTRFFNKENHEKGWADPQKVSDDVKEFVNPAKMQLFRDTIKPEDLTPFFLDSWLKGVR